MITLLILVLLVCLILGGGFYGATVYPVNPVGALVFIIFIILVIALFGGPHFGWWRAGF